MRRRVVFALLAGVSMACGFVACGLDESGEAHDGGVDATSNDAPIDVPIVDAPIDVPQACKTLDATACIDAAIPDGWTLVVTTGGDQLCPTTVDYDKNLFLSNLSPLGQCSCGCAVTGAVDCSGTIEAGSQGGGCNGRWTMFDAGNDAQCVNTNWNDPHMLVPSPPTSTANVHCDAAATSLPSWTASTQTSCTPKCSADFCNVGSTYQRCIISSQNTTSCPAPFTKLQLPYGIEAGVVTSCTGCSCSVSTSGSCSATVQGFGSNDCVNPQLEAGPTGTTCYNAGGGNNVNSFTYTPIVPDASCMAPPGNPGAQFAPTSSATVCCLP